MAHILQFLYTLTGTPAFVLSAWLWERTTRRYLAVKPGKCAYFARLLLFCAGSAGPMWIGDENMLFFLAGFLGVFYFCYQAPRAARAVSGVVFYLLVTGINMMLDSVALPSDLWDPATFVSRVVKLLAAAVVYWLSRKRNPEGDALQLPTRLWGLCGLLSLAPAYHGIVLFPVEQLWTRQYGRGPVPHCLHGAAVCVSLGAGAARGDDGARPP